MLARIKALHAGMFLAGGLLVSQSALGLVLGDIALTSTLDEPLQASIELDSLAGLDASMIEVALGDQAAYDSVDIARDPFLDGIQFAVEVDNENEGRIILTSADTVSEPFLNLIILVTEPGGVTQKEYTLLVELPSNTEVPPPEPAPAIAGEAAPIPAVADSNAESYTVTTGDTVWDIAASTRPDASVSVQQMMVAIQRANPDAFIDNNINRLINGRVLRIPTLQDINVIDAQAAVAQVNQQNTDLGGQPLANNGGTGAAGGAVPARDQLSVLTGDDSRALDGGSSDLARTIAVLETELMLSEESLDRARIENLELNNRLSSLQEQIDLLENIIAIEDERIAQLQSELTAQADATAQALASAQTSADAITDLNNQSPSGLTGLLQNTVVLLGAGLALVLAFLSFLFYRRRQALADADERTFNPALTAEEPDVGDDEEVEEKPGLLAGLLTRFRRSEPDDDDYETETVAVSKPAPVPSAPLSTVKAAKNSTDSLLDEMGINDDMLSLDDALDGIDSSHTDEAEVFAPVEDAMPTQDATPETFEFTFKDRTATETAVPIAVPITAKAEALETFDFKPGAPADIAVESIEVIAFPVSKPAQSDAAESADDDLLDLGDLSFDDTMVIDDTEEQSDYKPRTGNECDTKLDLATAYEAMGDVAEAIEILDEVIAEGSAAQVETAIQLKKTWQSS